MSESGGVIQQDGPGLDSEEEVDREQLANQVIALQSENERLRQAYTDAKQSDYRQSALGFGVLGLCAMAGAVLFPSLRRIFIAFGGTGLFISVAVYYLTPEQFVSARTSESVYTALAGIESALQTELNLQDEYVYIPTPGLTMSARLYIPQRSSYTLPDPEKLASLFVTDKDEFKRGVSLPPTAHLLYTEFERASSLDPAATVPPVELGRQLSSALTDQFELVQTAQIDAPTDGERVLIGLSSPTYGQLTDIAHPAVSLLGVGMAAYFEEPFVVDIQESSERADVVVELEPLTSSHG